MSKERPSQLSTPQKSNAFAICAGCSCLCDDIPFDEHGKPDATACETGARWFAQPQTPNVCFADGQSVLPADAVSQAAQILSDSNSPLVCGLDGISAQAQFGAFKIASQLRATIDTIVGPGSRSSLLAMQQVGKTTATLGEISARSQTVVFWFCDPDSTHPRLIERYCKSAETVVFIGGTSSNRDNASIVAVDDSKRLSVLKTLRMLVRGESLDDSVVLESTGHPLLVWEKLLSTITATNYSALFYGEAPLDSSGVAVMQELHLLSQELNSLTRFVTLGLREDGNALSGENILAASCGFPFAVNLYPHPQYGGEEFSALSVLSECGCDAVLACSTVSIDPGDSGLRNVAGKIVLTHQPELWSKSAEVVISIPRDGIDGTGDWCRLDNVPLRLNALPENGSATDISAHEKAAGAEATLAAIFELLPAA